MKNGEILITLGEVTCIVHFSLFTFHLLTHLFGFIGSPYSDASASF